MLMVVLLCMFPTPLDKVCGHVFPLASLLHIVTTSNLGQGCHPPNLIRKDREPWQHWYEEQTSAPILVNP